MLMKNQGMVDPVEFHERVQPAKGDLAHNKE